MISILYHSLAVYSLFMLWMKPLADSTVEKSGRHPLHLSSTSLNFNSGTETFEISSRIFTDDFEAILAKKFNVKSDLLSSVKHEEMDKLVKQYIAAHLQLKADGKSLRLNYVGFENDREAVVVYLESDKVKNIKKLETTNSILYDHFDDQTNLIHVYINAKRKSVKLDYPENKTTLTF